MSLGTLMEFGNALVEGQVNMVQPPANGRGAAQPGRLALGPAALLQSVKRVRLADAHV